MDFNKIFSLLLKRGLNPKFAQEISNSIVNRDYPRAVRILKKSGLSDAEIKAFYSDFFKISKIILQDYETGSSENPNSIKNKGYEDKRDRYREDIFLSLENKESISKDFAYELRSSEQDIYKGRSSKYDIEDSLIKGNNVEAISRNEIKDGLISDLKTDLKRDRKKTIMKGIIISEVLKTKI